MGDPAESADGFVDSAASAENQKVPVVIPITQGQVFATLGEELWYWTQEGRRGALDTLFDEEDLREANVAVELQKERLLQELRNVAYSGNINGRVDVTEDVIEPKLGGPAEVIVHNHGAKPEIIFAVLKRHPEFQGVRIRQTGTAENFTACKFSVDWRPKQVVDSQAGAAQVDAMSQLLGGINFE